MATIMITIGISLTLVSCTDTPKNGYEQSVTALTASEMEGRLTGTEGNAKAQAWMEKQFSRIGLSPLEGDSFAIPYDHVFFDPEKQQITLEAIYEHDRRRTFKHGASFLVQAYSNDYNESVSITTQRNDPDLANKMLILDREIDLSTLTVKPKAVLVKTAEFKNNVLRQSSHTDMPVIQISPMTYQKLIKDQDKLQQLQLQIGLRQEQIEANNVVGLLPGRRESEVPIRTAIVISAHFDGVGWMNGTPFNGALDNASGVSALLELATNLKEMQQGEADIVFAAFNGGESDLQGSNAFVKQLTQYYDFFYNINLDSIGGASRGAALITSANNSTNLALEVGNALKKTSIPIQYSEDTGSNDHLSFSNHAYQSITISDEELTSIHTRQDTAQHIEYEYLEQLVNALAAFLADEQHQPASYRPTTHLNMYDDDDAYTEAEIKVMNQEAERQLAQLQLGQYKQYINPITYKAALIYKYEDTIRDSGVLEGLVQGVSLPQQFAGYTFEQAHVRMDYLYFREMNAPELYEIYTIEDLQADDITSLGLQYTNGDTGISLYVHPLGKDEIVDMNYSSPSVTVEEYLSNEAPSYYLQYYTESDNSLSYITFLEVDGNRYYMTIHELMRWRDGQGLERSSTRTDKEKLVELVQKLPLESLIRELGL
ncbi:M28 family metallopeptidase [Paenibacillus paeoniae]|nr:M28 family metallopeptidase [Paenibacillus paeoniae]